MGALWAGDALGWAAPAQARDEGDREPSVTVSSGTNFAAAVSPDGRWLALDLFTVVWLVPVGGGRARRLTEDAQDASRPSWSPDGQRLVFQSFRDGYYQLWLVNTDGTGLRQLTDDPADHQEPAFSPDGRHIAFASDAENMNAIWVMDLGAGTSRRVTTAKAREITPTWSPDGRRIAFTVGDTAIDVVELAGGARSTAVTAPTGTTLCGPAWTPDGTRLAYTRFTGRTADLVVGERTLTSGEDVFGFPPTWLSGTELVYTADGLIRRRTLDGSVREIAFTATLPLAARDYRRQVRDLTSPAPRPVRGIASPVLSPDGHSVAFRALNALWVMPVGGRPTARVSDGFFNTDPDFHLDGTSLVYGSDRSGTANLWRLNLADGSSTQLTDVPRGAMTPRWSPDGGRIAYQDADGAIWVLAVSDGSVRQVLPALFQPGRPAWSPDGRTLAVAAVRPASLRNKSGTNQILTVDLETGATTYAEPAAHRSVATRGDDGPLWTPDGRSLVFVMESTAWALPVDGAGRATGPARQLTREVTDAVSVGDRGRTLMYLSNGLLRTVPLAGGTPRTVPVPLTYRVHEGTDRLVLRAGALWDGVSRQLRRDVDVVIEGTKVAGVVPAGSAVGGRIVDASGLTVMPGLIDLHTHWFMRGRGWGDRQGRLWLSYGVTTARSVADPVYQMVETRESSEAGVRVMPRFLGTGEALDGNRVLYNAMRPVQSAAQLDLELSRAEALAYDLLKCYIRLPVALTEPVVARAHRMGVPVTSHYAYPAAHTGLDAMEHVGGGNRLGYTHTVSRLGRTSDGVVDLFARSGMPITPTLIYAAVLYAEDRSLLEDPRTKALFPLWEYELVEQLARNAVGPAADTLRFLLAGAVDLLKRVHAAGGLVVAGTDAPLDTPALAMHLNLRALAQGGLSTYDVLRTATANSARVLGLADRLGTVEPGRFADLAVVAGDPLADVKAAAAVRMVVTGGRLHSVDDLLRPFRQAAATTVRRNRIAAPLRGAQADFSHDWHRPGWVETSCSCAPPR
ncbi:amidohydrolase family protein [Streptomyces sp. GS7]|uniref:amidohydrolase family protein n=1 Tax=Streptomyces sp. GS7 TaxID=2692234 RepID=UPI0013184494|nr:amidohydrolase family protein [Streptomyces sp. GS7]QHC23598.1 amidohydrolase family protein [Streptomyces sp. GS7]